MNVVDGKVTLRGFTLVPGYIYVDVIDGPLVMYSQKASANYVVASLRRLGVKPGQIRNTVHVLPKGTLSKRERRPDDAQRLQ